MKYRNKKRFLNTIFKKILFIHEKHTHTHTHTHTHRGRDTGRGRSRLHREPNVGLDPRTPGSRPEPKADAQPLSHPGVLIP